MSTERGWITRTVGKVLGDRREVSWDRDEALERSASRYLEVVKAALLDEHYLDNELRLEHLGRERRNGDWHILDIFRTLLRHDNDRFIRIALVRC